MHQPFQTDLGSLISALHEEFLEVCGDDALATLATTDLVNEMLVEGRLVLLQDDAVAGRLMEPIGIAPTPPAPSRATRVMIVEEITSVVR